MANGNVALFNFAGHRPTYLADIKERLSKEEWGKDLKILELYLRANFEIAQQQGKVIEREDEGYSLWRAGYLLSPDMSPIWLKYKNNDPEYKQKWKFDCVLMGETPVEGINAKDYSVIYNSPTFDPDWSIYIDPVHYKNHILIKNKKRLETVFGGKALDTPHRIFIALYGEMQLKRKEAYGVIAQWYENDYNFLMPLHLTVEGKVDLIAALIKDEVNKRYVLKTLLYPHYAHAYARAIVKSRSQIASWVILDDESIIKADFNDDDDGGGGEI